MRTSFNDLKARNILSKEQMRNTVGGKGTCNVFLKATSFNGVDMILHNCSKEEALSIMAGASAGSRWCCDSCGSASWL